MSSFESEIVDELPPMVRGGAARNSAERQKLVELLNNTSKVHKLVNFGNADDKIPTQKEYAALQQRIRQAAEKQGLKVKIRWKEDEKALYFQSSIDETKQPVEEVSTNGKAKASASKK